MAKNKTSYTDNNVSTFIENVENEVKRNDSLMLVELYKSITGHEPKMYGPTIIGFGNYHYKYASGHEGDAPVSAFSPRKDSIVFYFEHEFKDRETLLSQLGKHKVSKSCVYVNKLSDIDIAILKQIITESMNHTKKLYPDSY